MHKLMELKEMLCEELEEYGSKDKLDVGGLEIVDKLAHAIKNIDRIIEAYDEEYSQMGGSSRRGSSRRGSSNEGGSYRGSSNEGGSYRGSSRRGSSYANSYRRDSRGRYSREGDMVEELRELMQEAPDQETRQEMQSLIQRLEQM